MRAIPRLLRSFFEALVRFFYPRLTIQGTERLPPPGAAIFVANHPNGLLDPVVLRLALGWPVRFLAKHTLFGNPFGRLAMEAFGAVPVYRSQDTPGAGKQSAAGNEATFARCREVLAAGGALALFPEGVSHSDPRLRPLKTGAARIALSAIREQQEKTGEARSLPVVPVALVYEAKAIFRSSVLAVVGRPVETSDRLAAYTADERGTVDALTDDIRAALDEVTLQAETRDLLEGVARVATWTAPDAGAADDPAHQHQHALSLLRAYRALQAQDPERLEGIVRAVREYARVLGHLGVRDPWALEIERVRPVRALLALGKLLLAAPVALLGALLGWGPYRMAAPVAKRVAGKEEDLIGTVKLLAGALFLLLGWGAEAAVAGWLGGPVWAVATLIAGPLTGYVALRFGETWSEMREALRHVWLRATNFDLVRRVADRRRALCDEVTRALLGGAPGATRALDPAAATPALSPPAR